MSAPLMSTGMRAPGHLVDVGWCALAVTVTIAGVVRDGLGLIQLAAGLIAVIVILLRRSWPVPTLAIGLIATFVTIAIAQEPTALLPTAVLLIYHVARHTDHVGATWAGLTGLVALTLSVIAVLGPRDSIGGELWAALAWPTLAAAAGDATRSRAEVVATALERAERAERTRDEIARRRVIEERLRIARDLHDSVAHSIAIVNVQAGVADHLLRTDPDTAHVALGHVRSSTQLVLDELANILGVLRSDNDVQAPTDPTPTLDDVTVLIDQAANAGLHITYQTSGELRPVPRTASIATYRLIQEALTNAQKHGDGHADVEVDFTPTLLRIAVHNRVTHPLTMDPAGFGLVGMRERVTAAGGMLTTRQQREGTFIVEAAFPLDHTIDEADGPYTVGDNQ